MTLLLAGEGRRFLSPEERGQKRGPSPVPVPRRARRGGRMSGDAGVVVGVPVQAAAGAGGGGPGGWTGVSLAGDGPPTFESDAGRGPGGDDVEALETEGVPAAAAGGVPWQLKMFTVGAVLYLVSHATAAPGGAED